MASSPRRRPCRLLGLWLCVLLPGCDALIPRPCAANATRPDAVCCPAPPGATEPCGGHGRGLCRRVRPYDEVLMDNTNRKLLLWDDRWAWPSRFFTFLCECQGAYFGYACHECWFGRTGPHCQHPASPLVRRNVLDLNPRERLVFRDVLSLSRRLDSDYVVPVETLSHSRDPIRSPVLRNVTVHEAIVFIHYFAGRPTSVTSDTCVDQFDFNHAGPGFATWHRYFLLWWERELGKIAKDYFGVMDFAVPYWDWTNARHCVPCTDDLVGDLSSPTSKSFLRKWRIFCPSSEHLMAGRKDCTGCDEETYSPLLTRGLQHFHLPTSKQVLRTLQRRVFFSVDDTTILSSDRRCKSFGRYLEGNCADEKISKDNFTMHNLVHRSTTGALRLTRTSPNDPIFLLHHSQVDRLFQAWYKLRSPTEQDIPNMMTLPGHCRQCFLVGFLPTVTHGQLLVDLKAMGIRYDSFQFDKLNAVEADDYPEDDKPSRPHN